MRACIQRVISAEVGVNGESVASIGHGIVVFVGVFGGDAEGDARWLGDKCAGIRLFEDSSGRMSLPLRDGGNQALVIPNFTLCGSVSKGRRPDFTASAPPALAKELISVFAQTMREAGVEVSEGIFGADMRVTVINDGPVTVIADSRE